MLKPILAAAVLAVSSASVMAPQVALAQSSRSAISTSQFVTKAAMGDLFEIESSKLALSKSTDSGVKQLAQMLIDDHTMASKKLQGLAKDKPPGSLDKEHSALLQKLQSASGAEFTRLYLTQQLEAHREAVELFEAYSKNGEDAQLKSFASETLPKLRQHLEMVQKLQKSG